MSDKILSPGEIDELLHSVETGELETARGYTPQGNIRPFDLAGQERIVRGQMPTLEMINQRFVRLFRASLFSVLRRTSEIAAEPVKVMKFQDYIGSLSAPCSLNLVETSPLEGSSLLVLNADLVFSTVDMFFGGDGRPSLLRKKDFSAIELRLIDRLRAAIIENLQQAWAIAAPLQFGFLSMEINPQFANIVSPSELVLVSRFPVKIESGGGELDLVVPYSTVDPIREVLDSGLSSDRTRRTERWTRTLTSSLKEAKVELRVELCNKTINIRELMNLRPGDILPVAIPERVRATVAGVECFSAQIGRTDTHLAVKVDEYLIDHRSDIESLQHKRSQIRS